MTLAVRRTSTALAAIATAGVSSIFLGAAPAQAATPECGATGALVSPGICEQTYTSGTDTFTPTPQMTKLEALLVGAGGAGADQTPTVPANNGYANAGGGGSVTIVDFSGATAPLAITVAAPSVTGTVTDGSTTGTAVNGSDASPFGGGQSGSGQSGSGGTSSTPNGGGGAGGASSVENGGAGITVSAIAPGGSLFTGDTRCFGGGGAAGFLGTAGIPGCGGGGPTDTTGTTLTAPTANSGGGGGGLQITQTAGARAGASGVVILRWSAIVTVTFSTNGTGTAPAPQSIGAGSAPVRPADPTAPGFVFDGWYTDASLTTLADFTAPVTASTTLFAKWSPALAASGSESSAGIAVPLGLTALLAGATLVAFARRRPTSD